MIKLETVIITNFRGIKKLSLDLSQNNFAISGPNGTGKSGIVDAIEFALTGNITRLTGRGSKELSVKDHAPHVDLRTEPSKATVSLSIYSPSLQTAFVLERSVSKPNQPTIYPKDNPAIADLVKRIEKHPELALSRREIVKYIIAEPGARSDEVQALLKLKEVGKLRKHFTSVVNGFKRDSLNAEEILSERKVQLLSGLGIVEVKSALILDAVNKRRALLAAEALGSLEKETNFKGGIEPGRKETSRSLPSKATVIADIESFRRLVQALDSPGYLEGKGRIESILMSLEGNTTLMRDQQHLSLLQKGLELLESSECPLCGTHWEIEELRHFLQGRLANAHAASEFKANLVRELNSQKSPIRDVIGIIALLIQYAAHFLPGKNFVAMSSWKEALESSIKLLEEVRLQDIREFIDKACWKLPAEIEDEVRSICRAIESLPDRTETDAALEFLVVAQERFENYSKAKAKIAKARRDFEIASQISDTYSRISDESLSSLYEGVQKDFSRYYALIHHEDEGKFFARLIPSIAKLSFAVDFYGRGTFPPGAYHSEGHQDSMGLCLYLALMKKTMGAEFNLAILDDVLMSVDASHRKDVVRLLKSEFPNTQFILTTHDQVWLNHMVNEGLVLRKSSLQIKRWTVDDGPLVVGPKDVWVEIGKDLENNDIVSASALLRHHLERSMATLAGRLRAQVEYHVDGAYDLGELISPVIGRWKELLGKAKASANSWNKKSEVDCLAEMESRFTALYLRTQIDSWEMNKALHYNEWANLQREDFTPLVQAYLDFLTCFECPNCKALLYVFPAKGGPPELLRCDCNSFNLVSAKSQRVKSEPSAQKPVVKAEDSTKQPKLF